MSEKIDDRLNKIHSAVINLVDTNKKYKRLFKKANAEKRRLRQALEMSRKREEILFSFSNIRNNISDKKCDHNMVYPTDGSKPTCVYCGWKP